MKTRKSRVAGKQADRRQIAVQTPATDDKANAALLKFLSRTLGVPPSRIGIARGAGNRNKTIAVEGLDPRRIDELLGRAAGKP